MSALRWIEAERTWTGAAFESGVRLALDADGRIAALERQGAPTTELGREPARQPERFPGCLLLPGFVNAHSHAFQRGLRGRGEHFPAGAGSFWTWREAMYELVEGLTLDTFAGWTRRAFEEMLRSGFTAVGEFHYLHHADAAARDHAFDRAVLEAAAEVGLRLVLLSAFYAHGGFDASRASKRAPLSSAQARFATPSVEAYWGALDRLAGDVDERTQSLGVVVHSVRAATPGELEILLREARARELVLHVHLEEQRREVEDCVTLHGRTPMQLLLEAGEAAGVDLEGVCAVHCTHTTRADLARFLAAGGRVCVTPTTEASLADGTPDLSPLDGHPGRLSIGSDSNTRIDPFEELRWLEYAQRLVREERGVLRAPESGRLGPRLLAVGTRGGSAALGLPTGGLDPGRPADLVLLEAERGPLAGVAPEDLPEAVALASDPRAVRAVFVGGRRVAGHAGT